MNFISLTQIPLTLPLSRKGRGDIVEPSSYPSPLAGEGCCSLRALCVSGSWVRGQ